MRRRCYEVTELYALIDTSNQMLQLGRLTCDLDPRTGKILNYSFTK